MASADGSNSVFGAVSGDHLLRRDDVALRLAHDLAIRVEHHALAQQVGERLVEVEQPHVAHHLREEAAVQQVQDGVLDAADVLVDRHPAVRARRIERRGVVVRIGVAQVVPARARERVHRVRLATRLATALGAGAFRETLVRGQRLAGGQVDVLGQADGQVLFGNRHNAAGRAVNGGNRVAPVALARDQPVAQAELDLATAAAHVLERLDDGVLAL